MRILVVSLCLIAGGVSAADPALEAQLKRMATIDRFVWDGPEFLPRDSVERLRSLAPVVSETSKVEKNPHADGEVTYTTITFKNRLEIRFRTFGAPLKLQYIRVTVAAARWPIKHGLGVGSPLSRVLEVLGQPSEKGPDWISYKGETEEVVFALRDERVTKVVFDYYAD